MILRSFPFFLALALIAARLQGMGIVKDSLPLVPEDKELRAKNRAQNEEQKKAKEAKKAKSARKAQHCETADKNRREVEKAGLPAPESPETSVSDVEGGGDTHGLNKLANEEDEDEVIPPVGEGIKAPEGSKTRGGRRPLRGLKHWGVRESPPISLWTMKRVAPHEKALFPRVPKRGKGRRSVGPRCPHSRWRRRAQLSPAHRQGRRWKARQRCRRSWPPLEPPCQLLGRRGSAR